MGRIAIDRPKCRSGVASVAPYKGGATLQPHLRCTRSNCYNMLRLCYTCYAELGRENAAAPIPAPCIFFFAALSCVAFDHAKLRCYRRTKANKNTRGRAKTLMFIAFFDTPHHICPLFVQYAE